jgi:hypothetical protein
MNNDIETLRRLADGLGTEERKEAMAVLDRLDAAIAALEKIDKFEISANDSMVNQVFRLKNIARNALGRVK